MAITYEIVPATWRDWREMRMLEKACFGRDAWGVIEILSALLSSTVRLKAVAGNKMAGLVIGEAYRHSGHGWIATLGVLPDFRRQGIGTHLLLAAESRLAMPIVKLTVRRSNDTAIALYHKLGYKETAVWERYYQDGEAGIVMTKEYSPVSTRVPKNCSAY